MNQTRGQRLNAARTEAGLTQPELSDQTNIPLGHLRALENDDLPALPEAVYVQAYVRTLEDHLRVRLVSPAGAAEPEVGQTLRRTRAVASVSMTLLAIAASIIVFQRLPEMPEVVGGVAAADTLTVKVYAEDEGNLRAWVDGRLVLDESYAKPTAETKTGDRTVNLEGTHNVTLEVSPVGAFRYYRDGEKLKPVGRQSDERTLVFTMTPKTAP
jgi:cytoskeletal protein RodZ